mmetsp:Transcript_4311/g.15129  ORF Transcript_4311/g.15129 Transcript_4311/m.15129 type:complete len:898 (-) Transcript_4311:328-3021(-)
MASNAQDNHAPLRAQDGKKDEDDEEDFEYSPFHGIEKGAVLQEARIFHAAQTDSRKCQQVLTRLLYLLTQGESFTKNEATEVFFSCTKLFQNHDANLRRLVYLIIKELPPGSDEVIIVTASLMKDMTSNNELYKGGSIRVLCRILDSSLLQQVERYFKQAIVDKAPVVASAALVSGLHMLRDNPDIVKRWSSEVQDAVQSRNPMVQFHSVALLYQLKSGDRLAISKLVSSLTRGNVRSPLAQMMIVRCVARVIADSQAYADQERPFYDFLESCLRHKGEMVIFEAAKAIVELNGVTEAELAPAITILQLFLSSSKPVLRFAAVRILNKVAIDHPMAVSNCNIDMETLISDQNRSIATLAITTLLKTGNESSIDRLMKQMSSFITEIGDEFKIVVVDAVHKLCIKFPTKFRSMMSFLSSVLREEGGFEYKKSIINAILGIVRTVAESKETALTHLCEFIEDCEFTYLSTQILHLLGEEGPKTSHPAKYIRYVYNRIILENATVRAAAVAALANFGMRVPSLAPRVRVLLRRTLRDNDDEVRDRATMYLKLLGDDATGEQQEPTPRPKVLRGQNVSLAGLERCLREYLDTPMTEAFDMAGVPEKELVPVEASKPGAPGASGSGDLSGDLSLKSDFEEALQQIPEFADLGPLFKSCDAVELVEKETEYTVSCVKHIFASHVVLQFDMTNTIEEQVLEDVSVDVDLAEAEAYEEVLTIPATRLPYGVVAQTYVLLAYEQGTMPFGRMVSTLKFVVKEIDPSTGDEEEDGFEDEYPLEDVYCSPGDYLQPTKISNFRNAWDAQDPDTEVVDEYGIGQRDSLQDAVEAVVETLGLAACEGTEAVPPNARSHVCLLHGRTTAGGSALARVNFGMDRNYEVAIKLTVRGESQDVSESLHAIVAEG